MGKMNKMGGDDDCDMVAPCQGLSARYNAFDPEMADCDCLLVSIAARTAHMA